MLESILTDVYTKVTRLWQWDHAVPEPELGLDGLTCGVVLTVEQITELERRRRYQCVVVTEKVVDSRTELAFVVSEPILELHEVGHVQDAVTVVTPWLRHTIHPPTDSVGNLGDLGQLA